MARSSQKAIDKAWAALMRAAEDGELKALESALCAHPALAKRVGEDGMSALMGAALRGHRECVALLLPVSEARGADAREMTALMMAARRGHAACVELLLPASDPLAVSVKGSSALMWAALNGHRECVELLLPVSDLGARSSCGDTALDKASDMGHDHVVLAIERHQARLEAAEIHQHLGPARSALSIRKAARL